MVTNIVKLYMEYVNDKSKETVYPCNHFDGKLMARVQSRDRLDALAHSLPRATLAEHEQRHVVRGAHSERLEGRGGAAEGDEAGEVAVLVGSGDLAQKVRDSGALVELDGVVQRNAVDVGLGEQGWVVVADQELGGSVIGVALGNVVHRKAEVNVSNVQDVPLLGVRLAKSEHALQHLHRRIVGFSKRSPSKLVLVEELSDFSLGRKLLDAQTEHAQRHVVLGVRRNKSFQSVGGAAQLDETRVSVLIVRVAAVKQQFVDLVVVTEAADRRTTGK